MRLPLDPGSLVRAGLYALAQQTRRCDGHGYQLRRSCTHGRHVSCPLCQRDVTYQARPDRIVEIDPHLRPRNTRRRAER